MERKSFLKRWEWVETFAVRLMVVLLTVLTVLPASAQELVWEPTNGPYGGNISALLATSDGMLYAGTVGSGVFRSDNGGDSWIPVNKGLTTGTQISSFAVLGMTIYMGIGGGVFRSNDNGNSWIPVNTGLTDMNVYSLAVMSTTLYAGTYSGVFRSNDGGNSWTPVNKGLITGTQVSSFAVLDTMIYAGTRGSGVYRFDNSGDSWTPVNKGLIDMNVYSLAVMGTTLYAGTASGGVYRSDDGGDSWTPVNKGLTNIQVQSLAIMDTTLYAGTWNGIYRSSDSGDSWTPVNKGLTNIQVRSLAVIGTTLYAGTWSGVYRSGDGGDSWTPVNKGLTNIQVWSLAIMGTTLYAGTLGGGVFRSNDNGSSWTSVNTGLTNKSVFSFAVMGTILYVGTGLGGVFRYDDNGNFWTPIKVEGTNHNVYSLAILGMTIYAGTGEGIFRSDDDGNSWIPINKGLTDRSIYSFAVLGTAIYVGTGNSIFRFDDRGNRWINAGLTGKVVHSLVVSGTTLYAGTHIGVFRSDNGGNSWTLVGTELMNVRIRSLVITDTMIYAGTDNSGVFRALLSEFQPSPKPVLSPPPSQPNVVNSAPIVSNVKAQQRSGTKIVDITYDADDPDGNLLTVTVEISDDGGNTFKVSAKTFRGDVGLGIKPGKGKKITWDAGKDVPNVFGTNYRAKVTASDGAIGTKTIIGKDGAEMVLIPAGEFLMGSPEGEGEPNERPQHKVYLDAFYIDKYEVTNAQYKKFMDATGHTAPSDWNDNRFNKPEQPVGGVTWFDAEAYCEWAGKRLSTEAEWEKAARGTDGRRYPWGNEDPNVGGIWRANYGPGNRIDDGFEFTAPVGSYPAGTSPYGVMDMAGNVWEWVADWYDNGYYTVSPKNNPKGPNSGIYRVLRGGAWNNDDNNIRAANRAGINPDGRNIFIYGFRCAQDVVP